MFHDTGNGDYHFNKWENIEAHRWYYITVIYSCSDHLYNLYVDFDLKEKGFRSHHLVSFRLSGRAVLQSYRLYSSNAIIDAANLRLAFS